MTSENTDGVLGAGTEPIVTARQDPYGTADPEDAVDRAGVIGAADATQRPAGPEDDAELEGRTDTDAAQEQSGGDPGLGDVLDVPGERTTRD